MKRVKSLEEEVKHLRSLLEKVVEPTHDVEKALLECQQRITTLDEVLDKKTTKQRRQFSWLVNEHIELAQDIEDMAKESGLKRPRLHGDTPEEEEEEVEQPEAEHVVLAPRTTHLRTLWMA